MIHLTCTRNHEKYKNDNDHLYTIMIAQALTHKVQKGHHQMNLVPSKPLVSRCVSQYLDHGSEK